MNLFIIKYAILIGAVLTSTALVTGPLNPQKMFASDTMTDSGEITADAIYQFGSDAFYKELDKPGNEYMKANMEGYSKELVPTEQQGKNFALRWTGAVTLYKSGYRKCTDAFFRMATIPDVTSADEKRAACDSFLEAKEELVTSEQRFLAAKASSSAGSSSGFTIGMVIPRVSRISACAQDVEIACLKAVLADRNSNPEGFRQNLNEVKAILGEMKRLNAELKVLSDDFP
jgi:hypothetical protein